MTEDEPDRATGRRAREGRGIGEPGTERKGLENRLRPGPRVAQAKKKAKAKPKTKNFAICLAQNDEGVAATAWAGWVHSGEIANPGNILQPSIEDAYAAMTSQLAAGETVDNVWVYGHGDIDGFLHAIPAQGEPETRFDLATAEKFVDNSTNAAAFHAFCTADTKIHMYPCNAGLTPEALEAARDLFCGGQSGKACGPTRWFHILVRHIRFTKPIEPDTGGTGCTAVRFDAGAASAQELDNALQAFDLAIDGNPACFSAPYAKRMKASVRKSVINEFENIWFIPWFDDLKKAKLVPPKLRKGKSKRAEKIAAMWRLMGSPWPTIQVARGSGATLSVNTLLGMPFLSDKLLGFTAISRLPKWRDAAKKAKHVFPHEKSWGKTFASLPTGKLKAC